MSGDRSRMRVVVIVLLALVLAVLLAIAGVVALVLFGTALGSVSDNRAVPLKV